MIYLFPAFPRNASVILCGDPGDELLRPHISEEEARDPEHDETEVGKAELFHDEPRDQREDDKRTGKNPDLSAQAVPPAAMRCICRAGHRR